MLINAKNLFEYIIKSISNVYEKYEAESIARIILHDKFNCNFTDVLIQKSIEIKHLNILEEILSRLNNNEPIQYILGETHFHNIDISTDKRALIPRPETEEMVMDIIKTIGRKSEMKIIDLCTGSGCIALALKKTFPKSHVFAVDISSEALSLAKENAHKNNLDIDLIKADILSHNIVDVLNFDCYGYDIIVSNPPYVCVSEKKNMHKRILDYEPNEALFVDDDNPLIFYESIKKITDKLLAKQGYCFVEINEKFGCEVDALFKREYRYVEVKKDFRNKNRWVKIKKQ